MTGFSLRAFETEDAAGVAALLMRPKVRLGTMVFAPFTSVAEGVAFMAAPVNGTNIVAVGEGGSVIGHGVLFRGKGAQAHGATLGLAVHDEWWRRGVGAALMAAVLDTADNWLGLTRVALNVFVDNAPAIALYTKCGFEIEGTIRRQMFREGKFIDSYAMARLIDPPKYLGAP